MRDFASFVGLSDFLDFSFLWPFNAGLLQRSNFTITYIEGALTKHTILNDIFPC